MKYFDDTKLYDLMDKQDFESIGSFLKEYGLDSVDRDGRTLLMTAVVEDKKSLIEYLIKLGCNINAKDLHGLTALHLAAIYNKKYIVRSLLENAAEVDIQDDQGNTPLWRAAMSNDNSAEVINYLIKAGADKNKQNNHGVKPSDLLEK